MEINATKLRELRQARSWSQQHLADAAGLSLRTIQRAENQGSAAQETVMALCATLSIETGDLSVIPRPAPEELTEVRLGPRLLWYLAVWLFGLMVGVLVTLLIFK